MPDLPGWITAQVDRVELGARRAGADLGSVLNQIDYQDDAVTADEQHIMDHAPAHVLRRCAADRKILAEHRPKGGGWPDHYACEGCGYDGGYCPEPITEHINDCPTLLALAEGYGLTVEQHATLDRPEPERPDPGPPVDLDALERLISARPTSSVPPALRGPNWKARP